jgi:hypothetical protein
LSHYHTLILSHSTSFNIHCPSNVSFICTFINHFHPLPLPHSTSSFYSWRHLHQTFLFIVTFIKLLFSHQFSFHSSDTIIHYHERITQSVLFIEVDHSLSYIAIDTLLKLFYSLSHSSSLIIGCHLRRVFFHSLSQSPNFQ